MSQGRTIVFIAEGLTERAIAGVLKRFLDVRCDQEHKPRVRLQPLGVASQLLDQTRPRRLVDMNLNRRDVVGVVALMDVVVSEGRRFKDAADAIAHLQSCGPDSPKYRPHAAQHDFEAWLLPYWEDVCKRLRVSKRPPGGNPELVNQLKPPSKHLKELYRLAKRDYNKPVEARAILERSNLLVSANHCPQFKSLLNSLLDLAACARIP